MSSGLTSVGDDRGRDAAVGGAVRVEVDHEGRSAI